MNTSSQNQNKNKREHEITLVFPHLFICSYKGEIMKKCKSEIVLSELCFAKTGKYRFVIREKPNKCCKCWRSDCREYRIVVTVTKDAHGNLVADVSYPDGFPEFVNCFCPPRCCWW
ncbi:MAG: hypothetical protein FWG45_06685 [Oscillospiraceae bacterium]|nr:hypothetical protein [Oscillospiraceae bacterium]